MRGVSIAAQLASLRHSWRAGQSKQRAARAFQKARPVRLEELLYSCGCASSSASVAGRSSSAYTSTGSDVSTTLYRPAEMESYSACASMPARAAVSAHVGDMCRRATLLAGEAAVELEEEEQPGECDILVEAVLDEPRQAVLRQRAVHQQQAREEAELVQREVCCVCRLAALAPRDADAHICRLQHGNVVGAITDGQRAARWPRVHAPHSSQPARHAAPPALRRDELRIGQRGELACRLIRAQVALHELDDCSLLARRGAADHDRAGAGSQRCKRLRQHAVRKHVPACDGACVSNLVEAAQASVQQCARERAAIDHQLGTARAVATV